MGCVDTMYGHEDGVLSISVLQKQRSVSTGGQDRSCRMWKVEDESQLVRLYSIIELIVLSCSLAIHRVSVWIALPC